MNNCEFSRQKLKKEEKLIINIRSGIETLVNILKEPLFDYCFNNTNERIPISDVSINNFDKEQKFDDISITELYKDNIQGYKNDEPDLKPLLTNMNELFDLSNEILISAGVENENLVTIIDLTDINEDKSYDFEINIKIGTFI